MTTSFIELYQQFREIAERGDEREANRFLAEHIDEFPEKVRESILFAFLEEGLRAATETSTTIRELQRNGIAALDELARLKRQADDKKKLAELEDKIKP